MTAATIVLVAAMRTASPATAGLSYVVLALFATTAPSRAIFALVASWAVSAANESVVPLPSMAAQGRALVVLASAASVGWRAARSKTRASLGWPTATGMLLGVYLLSHAFIASRVPEVSALKAILWLTASTVAAYAWRQMSSEEARVAEHLVIGTLAAVMALSVPLLGTAAGYALNGTGFQGVLNHPQALGVAMALLALMVIPRTIEQVRPSSMHLVIGGCAVGVAFLSKARTGLFSIAIGLFVAICLNLVRARRGRARGVRDWRILVAASVTALVVAANADVVLTALTDFVAKDNAASGITETYYGSRGPLIDPMLENIEADPLSGIGFGVSSKPEAQILERDSVTGLPVTASVEKGILLLAILEEAGAPGLALLSIWILLIGRAADRNGLTTLSVFVGCLSVNMGEAVLMSPGGIGIVALVLLGWASMPRTVMASDGRSLGNRPEPVGFRS